MYKDRSLSVESEEINNLSKFRDDIKLRTEQEIMPAC